MANALEGSPAGSVLYVEDEENDVLFMQLAYRRAGIVQPLKIAINCREAIDYLAGHGRFADRVEYPLPCLVLLDINLPIQSGFEVLRWIRAQPQFQTLPVIVYSASTQERDPELAQELGANDYIVKPSTPSKIAELLVRIKERWLCPEAKG